MTTLERRGRAGAHGPGQEHGAARALDVVLLHGWGRAKEDLLPLGRLLAARARVHLVDLPGFGASPHPGADWSTADYATHLAGELRARGIARAVIGGHSFGGRIAVRLAAGEPGLAAGLVLLAAAGLPRRRTARERLRGRWIALLRARARARAARGDAAALERFRERFGSRDYRSAGALRGILVRAVAEELSGEARAVRCPTLCVWGADDAETPVETGARYAELVPDARLVVLPRKGHAPHEGMGAHLVAHHVLAFLARLAAPPEARSDPNATAEPAPATTGAAR